MRYRSLKSVVPLLALALAAAQAPTAVAQSLTPQVRSGTVDGIDREAGLIVIDDRQYVLGPEMQAAATGLRPGTHVTFSYAWTGQQRVITRFEPAPRR